MSFTFDRRDFSLVMPEERRVTEPGEFLIMAGSSSKDSDLLQAKLIL